MASENQFSQDCSSITARSSKPSGTWSRKERPKKVAERKSPLISTSRQSRQVLTPPPNHSFAAGWWQGGGLLSPGELRIAAATISAPTDPPETPDMAKKRSATLSPVSAGPCRGRSAAFMRPSSFAAFT